MVDGINISEVSAEDLEDFSSMTFPALRHYLAATDKNRGVIGVAARTATDDPIGFAFGKKDESSYEFLSVFVNPFFRRQGIGTELVTALHDAFTARGCQSAHHDFTLDSDDPWYETFLDGCHYSAPIVRQLVCKTTVELACQTPWLIRAKVPDGYRIELWADLPDRIRNRLLERKVENPTLYPEVLDPFKHLKNCHAGTSVALLRDDEIQGWIVSHVLDDDTLRWTLSYVMDELQGSGRIIPLWWDIVQRQRDTTDMKRLIWTVPVETPRMLKFAERRMRPWLLSLDHACTAVRVTP